MVTTVLLLFAQTGFANSNIPGSKTYFDIPRQRADVALTRFAEQADLTLIFPYELTREVSTNRLVGRYTVQDAVKKLLAGTRLEPQFNNQGVLTAIVEEELEPEGGRMNAKRETGLLAALGLLMGGGAAVGQESTEQQASPPPIEEIVVQGIRQSLAAAVDVKRNSDQIMDAIVAEDIGKLPDNNIAEALQRVSGVSINRDFGVGNEISIRGLPQNRVELNGRSTLGDGRNGIAFQDFPSSFLSRVEVIKSPTPEMIEGALGGTISLKTMRPLELNGPVLAGSLDGEYADKAEHWAPILNLSAGDNWDIGGAGTFGAMAMIAYQDRTLRDDRSEVNLFVFDDIDVNLDGTVDDADRAQNTPSGQYVVPMGHKFEPYTEERERTALNLYLQWAPVSERGNIYLDLNRTERDGNQEAYSILPSEGDPVATADSFEDANGRLNNYRIEGVALIPKTWSEFRHTDANTYALGGEWDLTDKLKLSGEYSMAESNTYQPRSEFNLRGVDPVAEAADPAAANDYITSMYIHHSEGSAPSAVFDGGNPLIRDELLALREYRTRDLFLDNEEDAIRLDLEYADVGGLDWFTALKAGVRTTQRSFERNESEVRIANIYRDMLDANGDPTLIWVSDINAALPGSIITPTVGEDAFDYTGWAGASDLRTFTVLDAAILKDTEQTFDLVQQLMQGSNFNTNGLIDANGTRADNLKEIKGSYALIDEDTAAFYIQANLDFEHVKIIVGGRQVETELTSTAYNQDGDALVSETNKYSDFLPSFNATVFLTDDTIMRFAAAKVMRRPDFDLLSPTYQFNSDRLLATKGNPSLEPFRATQFDVAAEHYFGDGDMVSATVFFKSVESFLKSEQFCADQPEAAAQQNLTVPLNVCIRPAGAGDSYSYTFTDDPAVLADYVAQGRNGVLTTVSANGSSGTVQGIELAYQQAFDTLPGIWSGLGINANYTYSQSEDPDGVPLEDISENTVNLQLYWEYNGFAVRAAYNYRDRFLDNNLHKRVSRLGEQVAYGTGVDDPTVGNDYRDDLQQLDFSASWDVTDSFTLAANITNLTGEATFNQGATGSTWQIRESDRRFTVGARYAFQ